MGIDILVCNNCGKGFMDCEPYKTCMCSSQFCYNCMDNVNGIEDFSGNAEYKECKLCKDESENTNILLLAEELRLEYKELENENTKKIEACSLIIKEYEAKKQELQEQLDNKLRNIEGILLAGLDDKDFKNTKTQRTFNGIGLKLVEKFDKDIIVKNDSGDIELPKEFIEVVTTKKFKWAEAKKNLAIVDGNVIDKDTGEFVNYAKVETKAGEIKLTIE